MELIFFVGSNGSGKTFALNQIYKADSNSLFIDEEGKPEFLRKRPKVKIDFATSTYYFNNDLIRGVSRGEVEEEKINEKFMPILKKIVELQGKIKEIKIKSKGQEKFATLLDIFTDYSFNNIECICIDEPENFLDEDYIKEISQIILQLAEIDIKVSVATHSTRILMECEAKINQITLMDRTKKLNISYEEIREIMSNTRTEILKFRNKDFQLENIILDKLNACDNDDHFRVLVSQIIENEDFFKCLFNKRIILVEGASEIIALKYLKTSFDSSTQVFTSHGKVYMPFFVNLFERLGKDVIVIIDTDEKEKQDYKLPWIITQYFKNKQTNQKLKLIVHEPDLERYYDINWKKIIEDIGMKSKHKRLSGELKPIVSMIFFYKKQNQDLLLASINSLSEEESSQFDFS